MERGSWEQFFIVIEEVNIQAKHSKLRSVRWDCFKVSAEPDIALTMREWKFFCHLKEGEDIPNICIQINT